MRRTHTLVIGGGQAGLAMSACLSAHRIDHVVIERGRIAERWRSERWDSLRMLTPAWQSRLPGFRYAGPDPDGFLSMADVTALLEGYAHTICAPLETRTRVLRVEPTCGGYHVRTSRGDWLARNVVVATGHCDVPHVPALAGRIDRDVLQLTASRYRRPDRVPDGGVLVVGASASGVQIAEELHAAGRRVVVAAGRHKRMPRRHRGRDIMWWLDAMGMLDERLGPSADPLAWRRRPSLQLVGRRHGDLDLGTLAASGVRVLGRLVDASGTTVCAADDLARTTEDADAKLERLLERIDRFIAVSGLDGVLPETERLRPIELTSPAVAIDLRAERIRTIVWATGYRRRYPWLHVPVIDADGELVHAGGVTPAPGLYVLGLQLLRRRSSSFLDGVGRDAAELAARIARAGEPHVPAAA